jgi:hypothetical protein
MYFRIVTGSPSVAAVAVQPLEDIFIILLMNLGAGLNILRAGLNILRLGANALIARRRKSAD